VTAENIEDLRRGAEILENATPTVQEAAALLMPLHRVVEENLGDVAYDSVRDLIPYGQALDAAFTIHDAFEGLC
jgi:hypothetical protein